MNVRSKKLFSLFLCVCMLISSNITLFAGTLKEEGGYTEYRDTEASLMTTPTSASQGDTGTGEKAKEIKDLSGNAVITCNTTETQVDPDGSISVKLIKRAAVNAMTIKVNGKTYHVADGRLIRDSDGKVLEEDFTGCVSMNSLKIRMAGSAESDGEAVKYSADRKRIMEAKGNQLLTYKLTINKNVLPFTKTEAVSGEMFLKTAYSGSVSVARVTFGSGKYAIVVTYDAATEYRGSKTTATSHYLTTENNSTVSGVVDGAIGIGVRLEMVSGNGGVPLDGKDYNAYYWQQDNGISLKRPKVYNGKKVGAWYENGGPYFKIPMSYSKKNIEGCPLTVSDKQALKAALASTEFHFTIEPRKISTSLITYNKKEGDKYYVKKLKYNSGSDKLTGSVRYRNYKKKKNTLNMRKLNNVGKNLRFVSKSKAKGDKKSDVSFEYNKDKGQITLNGINGYYGTAVITDHIKLS